MPRFSKEFYEAYLHSDRWAQKRKHIFTLRGGRCEMCHKMLQGNNYEVHHKTYAHFTYELDHELALLCKNCHHKTHNFKHLTTRKTKK